jgi:hypothetical protein
MRLEKVWLILPPDEAEDWQPASVFVTWEQAVATLRREQDDRSEADDHAVEPISEDLVVVRATDDEGYGVYIAAIPIEYTQK